MNLLQNNPAHISANGWFSPNEPGVFHHLTLAANKSL